MFFTFLVVWLALLALLALLSRRRLRESPRSDEGAAPGVNVTMRPNFRPPFPLPRDADGNEGSAASRELLDSMSSASAGAELNTIQYSPRDSLGTAQQRKSQASPRLQVPARSSCRQTEGVNAATYGDHDDDYDYVDFTAIWTDSEQGMTTRPKRGTRLDDIKRFVPCYK